MKIVCIEKHLNCSYSLYTEVLDKNCIAGVVQYFDHLVCIVQDLVSVIIVCICSVHIMSLYNVSVQCVASSVIRQCMCNLYSVLRQ